MILCQVISRKTTSVPLKSPAATAAVVSDDNSQQQHTEVGIDVGNPAMATPNSQSSQSSAGVVRIESTENLLTQRRRNESEPLSKYSLERIGSHDQMGRQVTRSKTAVGKSPVKRSSSERYLLLLPWCLLIVLLLSLVAMTTTTLSK